MKDKAAVAMALRRAEKLPAADRRRIASMGGRTRQDRRVQAGIQEQLWAKTQDAVEGLLERLRVDGGPRALFFHLGEMVVLSPGSAEYRRLIQRAPEGLVGTYQRNTTKEQVLEDLSEIPVLAQAVKSGVHRSL